MRLLVLLIVAIGYASAAVYSIVHPWTYRRCLLEQTDGQSPADLVGADIVETCVNQFLWQDSEKIFFHPIESDTQSFIDKLFIEIQKKPDSPRIRREYRLMTMKEREDYHRAVNMLKEDTSVWPNCYEAIARFHQGSVIQSAHFGAPFAGWHRIFLLIYEAALRTKIPDVVCPYWDPTLDAAMPDPTDSCLFSDYFAGTGQGVVTSGPYAHWSFTDHGPLLRNVGAVAQILTKRDVDEVLGQIRMSEITNLNERNRHMEMLHGKAHLFINGLMGRLGTAAFEPMFFNLHAFVDCWWEKFRQNQQDYGINPFFDYPPTSNSLHHPLRPLDGFTVPDNLFNGALQMFRNYTNLDAYGDFSDYFTCDPFPECSDDGEVDSPWLTCNPETNACQSVSIDDDLSTINTLPLVRETYQNSYQIDGVVDSSLWCYIPILVVLVRPASLKFNNFPIHGTSSSTKSDIYGEDLEKEGFIEVGQSPKTYENYKPLMSGFERVSITSNGINYEGSATEYAILDNRFVLSESIAYVPFRCPTPDKGSEVLFNAFDSGGRICRPICRSNDNPNIFEPCSGSLFINDVEPLQYSHSYAESVLDRWNFTYSVPRSSNENVYMKYLCDYQVVWPWDEFDSTDHSTFLQKNLETIG